MNTFSEDLKKEREARGITLADISKKTRINIKYLEAIEQGAFDVLPQTYIRAFIKAYAETIGLHVPEILKNYEIHVTHQYSEGDPIHSSIALQHQPLSNVNAEQLLSEDRKRRSILLGMIGVVVIVGAVIFGVTYFDSPSQKPVKETPFQNVVKEQEQKAPLPTPVDSSQTKKQEITPPAPQPDSLALRLIAMDSVWITVYRDSLPPRRGYLLTGRYRTYHAQKEFRISLSDAGAMKLVLNGTELAPLGPRGTSVRNVTINADFLKKQ